MDDKHQLSEIQGLPEGAVEYLKGQWIETLEEGLSAVALAPGALTWKDAFLQQGRAIVGDELYQQLTTPCEERAKGLVMPEAEPLQAEPQLTGKETDDENQ